MKHCCNAGVPLELGEYVKAHEDLDMRNTMRPYTFPGIYLGPTRNLQGMKKVFGLNTGVVKKPRSVTPFPIPPNVIKVVNAWGIRYQKEEKQKSWNF